MITIFALVGSFFVGTTIGVVAMYKILRDLDRIEKEGHNDYKAFDPISNMVKNLKDVKRPRCVAPRSRYSDQQCIGISDVDCLNGHCRDHCKDLCGSRCEIPQPKNKYTIDEIAAIVKKKA